MEYSRFFLYLLVMAGVTYLIRMLPMAIFRKKIESPFIQSFLFYIPYAVLGAMTFPAIFYSTASPLSAGAGTAAAVFLAYRGKSLLTVALLACAAVYITEFLIRLL